MMKKENILYVEVNGEEKVAIIIIMMMVMKIK